MLDQITLRESGEHEHRGEALARDVARRGQAVHTRHLDVEDHEVGLVLAHELDGLVAAPGLADDLVALLFEELLEIETDDRLVFRDHDACGIRHGRAPWFGSGQWAESSAAIRSSSASCSRSSSAIEPASVSR